jgi:glycine/D-amino acid oxidase-like deaminating enzyme
MSLHYDVAVIGGGFYGSMIAQHVRQYVDRVVLVERSGELLGRASLANQARVHNGYHYPRSLMTALRARVSFPRFVAAFPDCIDRSFDKYYAIASRFSKVTASQFKQLCQRIGAPIREAPEAVCRLFNRDMVEGVFTVEEFAFDAVKLRHAMRRGLAEREVDVRMMTQVTRLADLDAAGLELECLGPEGTQKFTADLVFNCTYSQINAILTASGLPPLPLKHEVAEMALVQMPEPLKNLGITVMCGPFFSCMPFPSRGLHSFSHVRYTPHCSWQDRPDTDGDSHRRFAEFPRRSNFGAMVRDAARYVPLLQHCQQHDSLWEVKTVLMASEQNDSRPILFAASAEMPKLVSIMAAKIDNIFDALDEIDARYFLSSGPSCRNRAALFPSLPSFATTPPSSVLSNGQ